MHSDFSRILTLLRKERGISQKEAAGALNISQALLSHYEKGIRECGLDFVVRAADFYGVSCDYLLGRSPERTGTTISIDEIPEEDSLGKENSIKSSGSLLPILNKKLTLKTRRGFLPFQKRLPAPTPVRKWRSRRQMPAPYRRVLK